MRAIWRHQRKFARQISGHAGGITRPSAPAVISTCRSSLCCNTRQLSSSSRRYEAVNSAALTKNNSQDETNFRNLARGLPLSCPGCGAPSQTIAPEGAGYYNLSRSGVKNYLKQDVNEEDKVMDDVLKTVDKKVLSSLGLKDGVKATKAELQRQTPICDRCHDLIHHSGSASTPIIHPSIESIQSIIEESPHKENHIYHIIDAADFPMSVIPNLTSSLSLPRLRTQNRRSKDRRYVGGRVAEVSFIITRSDLLAPQKEQVDALMPYLRETLRDALGKTGERARLGNVRCVSSKRGWWTKHVKEDVWNRGGAGWMVGKVNVGKSGFFETVFPKGRGGETPNLHNLRHEENKILGGALARSDVKKEESPITPMEGESLADLPGDMDEGVDNLDTSQGTATTPSSHATDEMVETESGRSEQDKALPEQETTLNDEEDFDSVSLLPPAQQETQYPVMPIISSLPGTTASPIRIPFGSGRGELIDLPGIARSDLDQYVKPENRDDLVMKSRITPEQYSIKPGQSLLLGGGLIRITPVKEQELVVLAYPFVPLAPHVTATAKAEAIQSGERETGIKSIIAEGVLGSESKLKSAGKFKLQWDVTKKRAGPLTSASAVKLKPETLAFKVYSADVLIEGVGWVELVAQVRKRRKTTPAAVTAQSEDSSSDTTSTAQAGTKESEEPVSTYKPLSLEATSDSALGPNKDLAEGDSPAAPTLPQPTTTTTTFKPLPTPGELEGENDVPEVEIFSPEGKFVAVRPPMNAWLLGGKQKPGSSSRQKSRPRLSMKSLKGSRDGRRASSSA